MRAAAAAVASAILLGGCSLGKDMPAVNAAIATFHRQLDAQDFATIYDASSPDMKAASTKADLMQLLAAVHRKLGNFETGGATGWNDNVNGGGHFMTIAYAAKYDRGPAEERFVYRLAAGRALLAGYHINSTALIVN